MRGHSEALSNLFNVWDKVHGAGSAESPKSQLDWNCAYKAKAGIFQKETVWAKAVLDLVRDVSEALAPRAGNGGNACSLSRYICVLVRAKLVTSTSTRRSETSWSLQALKACICLLKQQNGGSGSA